MSAMTREVLLFARGESNLLVRKVYVQKFVARGDASSSSASSPGTHDRARGRRALHRRRLLRRAEAVPRDPQPRAQRRAGDGRRRHLHACSSTPTDRDLVMTFADTGARHPRVDPRAAVRGLRHRRQGRRHRASASPSSRRSSTSTSGRVSYETETRRGTTFRVTLPLERARR